MNKEGLMLMKGTLLAGMATMLSGAAQVSPPPPLFTADERKAVIAYWAQPGRYAEKLPPDTDKNGPFQVRLSVPGSVWLREYNRLRGMNKVPPTANARPQNEEQQSWQAWIDAKIEHDRWNAAQIAATRITSSPGTTPSSTIARFPRPNPMTLAPHPKL